MHAFARFSAAGGVLALAFAASGAAAQQQMVSAPDEVRACLCLEQSINRDSPTLSQRQQAWQQKQHEVESLNAQVTAARSRVNVNDPSSIAAFKDLLAKRDAAEQSFEADITPKYRAFVEQYNAHVADFNQRCSGRPYDSAVVATVRQSLTCPAE